MVEGVTKGYRAEARDHRRRLSRRRRRARRSTCRSASATTSTIEPGRHRLRDAQADRDRGHRHRQAAVGQTAAEIREYPPPRALQGQGRAVLPASSSSARKARRSKAARQWQRIPRPPSAAGARAPLASRRRRTGVRACRVFRSSKHIYAQVIDDAQGVTLAAASIAGKDLRGPEDGRRQRGREGGRQADRRARHAGRRQGSFSTAAATCITGASRRWPMRPRGGDF